MGIPYLLSRSAPRKLLPALAIAVLIAHTAMLAWSSTCHSPALIEPEHLVAGVSHLQLGRFDLVRVNPPLLRSVAALPVVVASPATNWRKYDSNPVARPDYYVAMDFWNANGSASFRLLTWARWVCIPFSLIGACVCFLWAKDLHGRPAGFLALLLWCFCPSVLGHGALITADIASSACGGAAFYAFWRWLRRPNGRGAVLAGFVLGLAQLTKFTLLVFYPLWLFVWLSYRWTALRQAGWADRRREAAMLLASIGLSVAVINIGYGFEGSFEELGNYHFKSRLFAGPVDAERRRVAGANRVAGTCIGLLPIPLPRNYVQGIDRQQWEMEQPQRSFLGGEWRMRGWWYYYLYALSIKVPLGTWGVVFMALFVSLWARQYSAQCRDEMVLLLPLIVIFVLISSQTGFSRHLRYVFPILPFAFVWASKVARCATFRHWPVAALAGGTVCWSISSSLSVYPHSLSFFNELIGGPSRGHMHLLDSNIAWGQDLFYLKRWLSAHPEASPLHLAAYGSVDPRLAGVEFSLPPVGPTSRQNTMGTSDWSLGPRPGWYAVDVNFLHGSDQPMADDPKHWGNRTSYAYDYSYFQHFHPVGTAGYSIYIYHITTDQANRVRKELGLVEFGRTVKKSD